MAAAALVARCSELAAGGINLLLVREKKLAAGELIHLVRSLVQATRHAAVKVLVADRLDITVAAGANGVHLSAAEGNLAPAQVRRLMPQAFVTASCHGIEDVRRSVAHGADAVLLAPIFGKWAGSAQVSTALGLPVLQQAVKAAGQVPVFALGGVTRSDTDGCRRAGAAGIAGIRLFFPPRPT